MPPYTIYAKLEERHWEPVLCIQEDFPPKFTSKPLKWLRYVAAVVLGAKGDVLDHTANGSGVDYEQIEPSLRELRFRNWTPFKIVDDQALDHILSSRQSTTDSRAGFKQQLESRDGCCVFTGDDPLFSRACHLIPKSKGSDYLNSVYQLRGEVDDIPVPSIMDIKNGLLLTATVDAFYSTAELAFLSTPNFALDTSDVLPLPPPDVGSLPRFRFTANSFMSKHPACYHQKDLRFPSLSNGWPEDWPPQWLWDFIYGCVCSRHFSLPKLGTHYKDINGERNYYPEGFQTHQEKVKASLDEQKQMAVVEKKKKTQDSARARVAGRPHEHLDMYDFVLGLWRATASTPEALEQIAKREEEKERRETIAKEMTIQTSVEKVVEWQERNPPSETTI